MPIIVKNFTWKQSDEKIYIIVPLNGIHSSKVDVFASELYIKLHYSPFIFEIFLYDKIDETDTKIILNDTDALIELKKAENKTWPNLEIDYSKKEKIRMKEMAIEEVQKKTQNLIEQKQQRKAELDKLAIKRSMEMDMEENRKINELRKAAQNKVMSDFENWRRSSETPTKLNPYHRHIKKEVTPKIQSTIKPVPQDIRCEEVPALRKGGTILVTFTERIFPTPTRESQTDLEGIWLKKFYAAQRESGFVSDDLRPEERNPQWCKEKGDELLKKRNYKGALNAYSHGIKLSDKLPTLYSNRAVAHFIIGNYNKCIEDCSTALELLKPECGRNLNMRVKCIVRRAAALTRVGMLSKAINEMKCAVKLQPNDEKLKSDLYDMERAWEQDPDSD